MTGAVSRAASTVGAAAGSGMPASAHAQLGGESSTRARIARLILENGPVSAAALSTRLGLTPAAVRLRQLVPEIWSGERQRSLLGLRAGGIAHRHLLCVGMHDLG